MYIFKGYLLIRAVQPSVALQNLIRTHIVLGDEKYAPEVFLRFSYFTTTYDVYVNITKLLIDTFY